MGVHLADELRANLFGQLDQHVAVQLAVHQLPGELALRRRQRLEQVRDLGRVQPY